MARPIDPRDAEIAALRAELAQAKAATVRRITYKVSEKGGLSAYGLGRFPVTLYASQWEALDAPEAVEQRRRFIAENKASLATRA